MPEICENCGAHIGRLETPMVFQDHLVCATCHRRLVVNAIPPAISQDSAKSLVTQAEKAQPSTIANSGPVHGDASLSIPVRGNPEGETQHDSKTDHGLNVGALISLACIVLLVVSLLGDCTFGRRPDRPVTRQEREEIELKMLKDEAHRRGLDR